MTRLIPRRRLVAAALLTASLVTPAAHAGLAPTPVPVQGPDVLDGGDATPEPGSYKCTLAPVLHYTRDPFFPFSEAGTFDFSAGINCNFTAKLLSASAFLDVATAGYNGPWQISADAYSTYCENCTFARSADSTYVVEGDGGPRYWRARGDFVIEFPDHIPAWRFSGLCSPPSGQRVTCRRVTTVQYGP